MLIVVHYCYRFLCTVVTDSCALLLPFFVHSPYHFLCTRDFCLQTGVDMRMFATAACLVGWCGLRPRNDVSNGRFKSRKVTHGNRYLRQILIEIAWAASRTRNCFFSHFSYVQTTVKKKSKMKIQVAIARKILVAVWHMLSKGEDFIDIYLKRLEELRKEEEQSRQFESCTAD